MRMFHRNVTIFSKWVGFVKKGNGVNGAYHSDDAHANLLVLAEEEDIFDGARLERLLHLDHVIADREDLDGLVPVIGLGCHLLHDALGCVQENVKYMPCYLMFEDMVLKDGQRIKVQ